MEKKNVNMYLPADLVKKVKAMAATTGRTFSGMMEIIIREFLAGKK